MKLAIFSDLHDNQAALDAVLNDAEREGADSFIYLGDVGHDPTLFRRLRVLDIPCTFGNWEVSGLDHLPEDLRDWVGDWPATQETEGIVVAHATPDMPVAAGTTGTALECMREGTGWHDLFPRLDRNEDAVWRALAVLEERNLRVAFHGHTHVQKIWQWAGRIDGLRNERRVLTSSDIPLGISIEQGPEKGPYRYIVGVGSAGQPQDDPRGGYVLFDLDQNQVELRRI